MLLKHLGVSTRPELLTTIARLSLWGFVGFPHTCYIEQKSHQRGLGGVRNNLETLPIVPGLSYSVMAFGPSWMWYAQAWLIHRNLVKKKELLWVWTNLHKLSLKLLILLIHFLTSF